MVFSEDFDVPLAGSVPGHRLWAHKRFLLFNMVSMGQCSSTNGKYFMNKCVFASVRSVEVQRGVALCSAAL